MTQPHTYVLITGASAGIGAALAREYARRGQALILLARRRDRLEALQSELSASVACEILVADLSDPSAPQHISQHIKDKQWAIHGLVNNAGYGLPGKFHAPAWEEHARFLQVMVTSVCELTWRLLPDMQARGAGEILNVASLAGHVPGSAGHTLYAASKSFMIKFSESLALENNSLGIRVSALCPGFTFSEFHDVTGTRGQVSKMPSWMWMQAEEVARQGIDALQAGHIVFVPGRINRLIKAVTQILPDRWMLKLVQKQSKNFRAIHD
ncbi:MAG TPA: SDR family oxidoreductase [Aquimonas sp.]|nr:SDR family oxidoreductase [Aquimonas sp.]